MDRASLLGGRMFRARPPEPRQEVEGRPITKNRSSSPLAPTYQVKPRENTLLLPSEKHYQIFGTFDGIQEK
jgi:hypothetical protein